MYPDDDCTEDELWHLWYEPIILRWERFIRWALQMAHDQHRRSLRRFRHIISAQMAQQVLAEGWQTHGQEAAAWRPVYSCPLAAPPLSPPATATSTPGLTPPETAALPAAVAAAARAGNTQPRRCLDSFV